MRAKWWRQRQFKGEWRCRCCKGDDVCAPIVLLPISISKNQFCVLISHWVIWSDLDLVFYRNLLILWSLKSELRTLHYDFFFWFNCISSFQQLVTFYSIMSNNLCLSFYLVYLLRSCYNLLLNLCVRVRARVPPILWGLEMFGECHREVSRLGCTVWAHPEHMWLTVRRKEKDSPHGLGPGTPFTKVLILN